MQINHLNLSVVVEVHSNSPLILLMSREKVIKTLLCYSFMVLSSARNAGSNQHLTVDFEKYYYGSLRDKMAESMSVNSCNISGLDRSKHKHDIHVQVLPPSIDVRSRWGEYNKEKNEKSLVYFRTSEYLCSSKQFSQIKMGHFKASKGCFPLYSSDAESGRLIKQSVSIFATLHPDHSRCDHHAADAACSAGAHGPALVRQDDKRLHSYPFVVAAKNVIVAKSGMIALPCGPFGLLASCEAVCCKY